VWELSGKDSQWKQTAEWRAHGILVFFLFFFALLSLIADAVIHKLAWAPPEYGDILASCSYDRTVIIWGKSGVRGNQGGFAKWSNRAKLVDSRQSVNDIAFAPKHMGLMIATCSADGSVRLYEAIDVMNLMHWPLVDEFEVARDGSGASCIAWCPNQFILPSLVVGGEKKVICIRVCCVL
jgi:nucleoporin SEH1